MDGWAKGRGKVEICRNLSIGRESIQVEGEKFNLAKENAATLQSQLSP